MEIPFGSSDSIKLRKASQDDKEFAYQVKKAAFREYVERARGWEEDEQRKLHDRRFRAQDFRIIDLYGTDVGIMSVAIEPDCVFVNQLYILPEHQGQGVGRRCMLMVIEGASKLSLPVRLRVLKVNPRAVSFYERLGFALTGDTDTHFLMQNKRA